MQSIIVLNYWAHDQKDLIRFQIKLDYERCKFQIIGGVEIYNLTHGYNTI